MPIQFELMYWKYIGLAYNTHIKHTIKYCEIGITNNYIRKTKKKLFKILSKTLYFPKPLPTVLKSKNFE